MTLGRRLFAALALLVAVPSLILAVLSDSVLGSAIRAEVGRAVIGKLRVAHSIESVLDDLVRNTAMRIVLDPSLAALGRETRLDELTKTGGLQYSYWRYLQLLDDSAKTNPLLDSIDIVFEDADFVLNSSQGVVPRGDAWLASVVAERGFEGTGILLAPHTREAGPVLSYYFPFPPYLTERRGAVVIHVLEAEFSRAINSTGSEAGTIAVVSDGRVISDSRGRLGQPWDEKGTLDALPPGPGEGLLTKQEADGEHLIPWYTPEGSSWTYVGDHPLAALLGNLGQVRLVSALGGLALAVLGIAIAYVISRRFFHPVRRLIREVNQRLGTDVGEGNELGLLSGAFDTLLKRETQWFHDLEGRRRERSEEGVRRALRGESGSWPELEGRLTAAACLAVDGYEAWAASCPAGQREYLRSVVLSMAERAFACPVLGTVVDPRRFALVLCTDEEDGGRFADALEEGFDALSAEVRPLLGVTLTLAVGARGGRDRLAASWSEAEALLRQRFIHGPGRWFWAENPAVPDARAVFTLGPERALLLALEARDAAAALSALAAFEAELRRPGLEYDQISLALHQAAGVIVRHLVETGADLTRVLGPERDLHRCISDAETLDQALDRLRGAAARAQGRSADLAPGHVESMLDYIRTHYRHDFGVEDVALEAGLSYSHARKVFEDAMGESIVDHTHALRIDEARRLLVETSWPVEEVARTVGYNNGLGLHRHFKKATGKTPGDYRQRHRQSR